MKIDVKPIESKFHSVDSFREQIFALYPTGCWSNGQSEYVKMLRTHLITCEVSRASIDFNSPGSNSSIAWKNMDDLIEKNGVRGFFHTHPPGVLEFSMMDWQLIYSMAITYGQRILWHGVQSVSSSKSRFICANYIAGRVDIHDFGFFEFDINDPILILPMPMMFSSKIKNKNMAFIEYE